MTQLYFSTEALGKFLHSVLEGIRQAVHLARPGSGLLTQIRIIVVGGAAHPVDSGPRAFTMATLHAFEDALAKTELVPVAAGKEQEAGKT